jgi:hypothetical protein
MSRIRTIKPEFWTSEQVMDCEMVTRLMFIGMWNFADDYGRMPYSPRTIKAQVFPGDNIAASEIDDRLKELNSKGLILIYSVDDKEYLEITGWKHQKIDRPTSKHPAPFVEPSSSPRRVVVEPSPPEGKGREGNVKKNIRDLSVTGPLFEKFKAEYPRRDGAQAWKPAAKLFDAAVHRGVDGERIIAGARAYRQECERKGVVKTDKVAQALTWLRQERWDEYGIVTVERTDVQLGMDEAVRMYAKTGIWSRHAPCPEPGQTGSNVPAELLAKYGLLPDGRKIEAA